MIRNECISEHKPFTESGGNDKNTYIDDVIHSEKSEISSEMNVDEDQNGINTENSPFEENFLGSDDLLDIGSSSEEEEPLKIIVHQLQPDSESSLPVQSSSQAPRMDSNPEVQVAMEMDKLLRVDSDELSTSSSSEICESSIGNGIFF